jgi:hypothetical protein
MYKGAKMSKKSRRLMRLAKLRNPVRYWQGKKRPEVASENHYAWKGEKAGYRAVHIWVSKYFGTPSRCEHCGKRGTGHAMHWANLSGKNKRVRTDWKRLCVKCHKKLDMLKHYKATITGDKYPMDFTVEASSWSTAASRAVRLWQKRFKGSRADTLSIRITKGL